MISRYYAENNEDSLVKHFFEILKNDEKIEKNLEELFTEIIKRKEKFDKKLLIDFLD